MTYTFKLSRRLARFRAPVIAALVLALNGCDNTQSLEPGGSLTPDAAADVPSGEFASASFAGGIPIGMSAQPLTLFNERFNGAKLTIGPNKIMEELQVIRSRGGKVVVMLAANPRHYKDGNGHFSLTKWKGRIDLFKGKDIAPYINDGTIIGHYLVDEPNDPRNWNGRPVPPSMVEEMAKYSKQIWPDMPTIVRAHPSYLDHNHKYLDVAWAAYLWRRGNVNEYLRQSVADAQKRGLALVVGMNVMKGGNPNGTRMTASEVESWGSAMLESSYPCAFLMYEYNADFLSSAGMGSAMETLRRLAENRSMRTCRRGSSGGQTPPPPPTEPPPPPTEPPSEPPPPPSGPSTGVPFGPYGLPTSEMASFSGAVRGATPGNVLTTAAAARRAGSRVVLRLSGNDVANRDGTFSLTKWKAALDRYARVNLSAYVSGGTIVGHLLVQNPETAKAWGGRRISHATLEEMARHSRQRLPGVPTIVDASPAWLADKTTPWQYLDASLVTYVGSHGDAGAWVARQANAAGQARLGLLVGMNVLNGGTKASNLPGRTRGRHAMSASQLRSWGSALVAHGRVCGLLMSRYDAGYFGRSDVKDAVEAVGARARARAETSCRVRS